MDGQVGDICSTVNITHGIFHSIEYFQSLFNFLIWNSHIYILRVLAMCMYDLEKMAALTHVMIVELKEIIFLLHIFTYHCNARAIF